MPRDIEDFLKRAAERRNRPQGQQPTTRRPAPPQHDDEIIEIVDADPIPPAQQQHRPLSQRHSVDQHVESHLDNSEIAEHVSHLGDRIKDRDDNVDVRIHRKFDREIGHLAVNPESDDVTIARPATSSSQIAGDLAELMRSKASIRQAIIVAEVLKRPEF